MQQWRPIWVAQLVSAQRGDRGQPAHSYWLGYYRSDSVRLYRGLYVDAGPSEDADLVQEIFPPPTKR
jgi:hypothetical protein